MSNHYYIDRIITMIDVESIGLQGEGFAVALHTFRASTGEVLDEHVIYCQPEVAWGNPAGKAWVEANCDVAMWVDDSDYSRSVRPTTKEVRSVFWAYWRELHSRFTPVMAADVPWPVEANFLTQCIKDDPTREQMGPYPLLDVASIRLAMGFNPLADGDRLENEMPAHHPLADARQSARLFREALEK